MIEFISIVTISLIISIIINNKHFLINLLILESINLIILYIIIFRLIYRRCYFFYLFLVVILSRSVLGLSLLINSVSYWGSDITSNII